ASDTVRAARDAGQSLLLYAPIVHEDDFHAAVAYLVRRLDESTEPENFLSKSFAMAPGSAAFATEREKFEAALDARALIPTERFRCQDRRARPVALPVGSPFENEADTDFSLAHNRSWAKEALRAMLEAPPFELRGALEEAQRQRKRIEGFDPSRPAVVPYEITLADAGDVRHAIERAALAAKSWSATPARERERLLTRVAQELRARRGKLIAAMVLDGGKRVVEADTEVSEAIDFAEHYARSHRELVCDPTLRVEPRGVALVAPPWNFPLAIPAGGTFAALVAGNPVLLKPALETPFVASELVDACHSAGIPANVLSLIVCEDDVGSELVRDPRISTVVLTGATSTARLFFEMRPDLALRAETGGKNAMVVTAMADRDQAIKHAVRSAFSHAGQKCSATSLLILEAEVYDDPSFRVRLADATRSLHVGSAWDPASVVTPLIRPAAGALLRALTSLDEGEQWLVEPRVDDANPCLVHPGVKLGVRPGSFTHLTELFGPVLGVMRARDLDHAVELANATPYG
ncbi:MAG: aldehyde dehydrogenase family protein, partial [Polyangiaceae bacterium]|nr:aldehyde dehydrogenase family protein [Polyangiaceae bacterium]